MSATAEKLFQEALTLPFHEILDLMDRLEEHVEPLLARPDEPEFDLGPEHAEEIRRRIEDHESGRTKPIPFDEAMKDDRGGGRGRCRGLTSHPARWRKPNPRIDGI